MSAILDSGSWAAGQDTVAENEAAGRRPAFAAVAVMLGGLVAGSPAFMLTMVRSDETRAVHVQIGSTRLSLPSALLRAPGEAGDGTRSQVDLLLSWPDLGPVPRRVAAARQAWNAGSTEADEVQVTLSAADDGPAPEMRVAQLYARFLEPQVLQGPGDLLTRHFKRNSPYQGEGLVFSPPDGRKVAARCESEAFRLDPEVAAQGPVPAVEAEIPPTCIAEVRRRGLSVQLRFPPRLAGGLEAVQRRLVALLDRLAS